jgi:hypothetical protein
MKKYSIILFIFGFVLLFLFTQKVVLPLVYSVVKSDAFLVDSKDQGGQMAISNSMTDLAFLHCNNYIKSEIDEDTSISFSSKPLNVWSLGNYEYVVNGEAVFTNAGTSATKKYACRIAYENGDNLDGATNFDNWSVGGIDGIEGI